MENSNVKLAMLRWTTRRWVIVDIRFTDSTFQTTAVTTEVKRRKSQSECKHNIDETGRGGILRQSQIVSTLTLYTSAGGRGKLRACASLFAVQWLQDSGFWKSIPRDSYYPFNLPLSLNFLPITFFPFNFRFTKYIYLYFRVTYICIRVNFYSLREPHKEQYLY